MTFSNAIRTELTERLQNRVDKTDWALITFASFAAALGKIREKSDGWQVTVRVTGRPLAALLEAVARTLSFELLDKQAGKRDVLLSFKIAGQFRAALFFDFDGWLSEAGQEGFEPIFSAFFLACGVASDPSTGRYAWPSLLGRRGPGPYDPSFHSQPADTSQNPPPWKDPPDLYQRRGGLPLPLVMRCPPGSLGL